MNRSSVASLGAFILAVVAVGIVIGFATPPGEWYAGLKKPAFNPPGWVFGPVWTVLYVLIGIAGWRVWTRAPKSRAMALWTGQMILNWLWSPIFFGAEMPWAAFIVIVALLGAIVLFMLEARRLDEMAAWLFAPYAAWVAFATLLNGSIAALN